HCPGRVLRRGRSLVGNLRLGDADARSMMAPARQAQRHRCLASVKAGEVNLESILHRVLGVLTGYSAGAHCLRQPQGKEALMAITLSHGGPTMYHSAAPSRQVLVGTIEGVVRIERDASGSGWHVADRALTDKHVHAPLIEPQ